MNEPVFFSVWFLHGVEMTTTGFTLVIHHVVHSVWLIYTNCRKLIPVAYLELVQVYVLITREPICGE